MHFMAAAWLGQTARAAYPQNVSPHRREPTGIEPPAFRASTAQSGARGFAAATHSDADAAPREPPPQQVQQQQPEGRRRGRPKGSGGARTSSVKPGEADKFGALAAEWCACRYAAILA